MGVVVGLTLLLGIMLCAFALPAIHTGAHGITLGVAGPQDAVDKVRALDGFDVREYSSADEARTAIEQRKIYGALIVGDDNIEIMTASAASAQAAQVIGQAGPPLALRMKKGWTITDVRPFPADDPRGAGLSGGALPLALGGWIAAILIMQLIATTRNRLLAVFAFAVVGGLALTAIIQFGFGTLDGNYLLTSLAAMLGISATAMGVLGLRELLGGVGIGIAAVLLILLGNPLSGLSSAPRDAAQPVGTDRAVAAARCDRGAAARRRAVRRPRHHPRAGRADLLACRRARVLLPRPAPGRREGRLPGTRGLNRRCQRGGQRILKITARCTTKLMTVAVPCAMP